MGGFKQTGKCGNETDLVMEPTWDIADSKDTCSVTIDKARKGYCQCYGYDEDGRKGGNLITRNVGYSNCEENQPFRTATSCATSTTPPCGARPRTATPTASSTACTISRARRRSTATSRATASATTSGRARRRTS